MSIVRLEKNEPVIYSNDMAKGFDVQHRSIYRMVSVYEKDLKSFGKVRFRIAPSESGQNVNVAVLNEQQATFLATLLRNNEKAVEFKKELIKEFYKMRSDLNQLVQQQKDPNWMNVRKDGKAIYSQKTDVIKNFIEYAISQGSKSAKMYYTNFAKMENKAMFIFEQKYPNMREVLTIKQLMQVATADDVIEKAIKEGMDKEMFYKDIFQLAKERIIRYVEIIGQSPILGLEKHE